MLNKIKKLLFGTHKIALMEGLNEGKNVSIMGNVNFGSEPYLITLEDNVRVSFGVTFVTHDGGTWAFRYKKKYEDVIKYGKIRVGERTFIGCNTIIMPGVTIGSECVIGAGSIVTKDVPSGYVACGNPAKVIMSTEQYAEKCLQRQEPYDKKAYMLNKKQYLKEFLK